MDEESLVTDLGLLLSQVRFSRLALEDIERSTSRYAGIAISIGSGGGAALGAPPMEGDALRVHVVNLGDIAGGGIGDVLFGVLGGAGRFLGGFFGGLVGGTVSGVAFPYTIAQVASITENIVKILAALGIDPTKKEPEKKEDEGSGLLGILDRLDKVLEKVKEVLGFATSDAGGEAASKTVTDWTALIQSIQPVVGGLTLLAPMLTAAIASLINRLPAIQAGVLDLLEFAVRNALRLRAVIFAVLIDTVSLAARVVAGVLGHVADAASVILSSIFEIAKAALKTIFDVLLIIGPGLKTTIEGLIAFLNNDVVGTLNAIGDTSVIKLIWHLSVSLPYILEALAKISGVTLSADELTQLSEARKLVPSAKPTAPRPTVPTGFPDFATLLPESERDKAVKSLEDLGKTVVTEAGTAFGAAQGAVEKSAKTVADSLAGMDKGLETEISGRLKGAETQAKAIATAMGEAGKATSGLPQVDAVAKAYEEWLTSGGLATLMGHLNAMFAKDAAGPGGSPTLGAIATASAGPSVPAVPVEIDKIEIRLVKPKPETPPPAPAPGPSGKTSSLIDRGGGYVDPDQLVLVG